MARSDDPLAIRLVIRRATAKRPISLRAWHAAIRDESELRRVTATAWAPPGFAYRPGDVEARDDEGRWWHAFRWREPGEIEIVTSAELALARALGTLNEHPIVQVAHPLAAKLGAEVVEERGTTVDIGFGAGEWLRTIARERIRVLVRDPIFRFERPAGAPPIALDEWRAVVARIRTLRWLDESLERGVWRYGAALRLPGRHPNKGRLFQWCRGTVVIQRVEIAEAVWYRREGGPDAISALCRRVATALNAEIRTPEGWIPHWATSRAERRRGLARGAGARQPRRPSRTGRRR